MKDSGLCEAWADATVLGSGTAEHVMTGKDYSKGSSEASPTVWSCYANLNHYHYSFL